MMEQYQYYSIEQLLELLRSKQISVVELCQYFVDLNLKYGMKNGLNVIADFNPKWKEEADILDQEENFDLPLFGIPYLVKDNIDIKGMPTTAGSLAFVDNIASEDAPIIRKLKKAGAICIGKTNMSELANFLTQGMPGGYSSYKGQVVCAWNPSESPSGSSSGSGVATSAGLIPFALGTDTAFSIVGCASVNGVFGYKPMQNNIDLDGILPITTYLDAPGVMCKNFEDLVKVLDVILKKKVERKPLEKYVIGISHTNIEKVSQEQIARYHHIFDQLPNIQVIQPTINKNLLELMKRDFAYSLNHYLSSHHSNIKTFSEMYEYYLSHQDTMMKYGTSRLVEAMDYFNQADNLQQVRKLHQEQIELKELFNQELSQYDAVLMTGSDMSFHYANLPSIAIPFKLEVDGMPRGMILYSISEERLLSVAKYLLDYIDEVPYARI